MQSNTAGLELVMIIVTLAIIIAISKPVYLYCLKDQKWFIKITPSAKARRNIWVTLATICVVCYLVFRYSLPMSVLLTKPSEFDPVSVNGSSLYSLSLLTDLCSFAGLAFPLLIIFDKHKKYSPSFAVMAFLGGTLTLLGTETVDQTATVTWQFFFFSLVHSGDVWSFDGGAPISFLMHSWLVLFSMAIFISSPPMNWHRLWILLLGILTYMLYVIVITSAIGIENHSTGLTKGDYYDYLNNGSIPTYDFIKPILGDLPWQLLCFILYIFFTIFIMIIVMFKNVCHFLHARFYLHDKDAKLMGSPFDIKKDNPLVVLAIKLKVKYNKREVKAI